jgi:hypothetical protein
MTDAVAVSLISAVASLGAAALGIANNILGRRNTEHLEQTKQVITTLEKNTNSIKDELVKVTGQAAFAREVKQGEEASRPI